MTDHNDTTDGLKKKEYHGYSLLKATKVGGILGKINMPFSGLSDMNNVTHLFFKYGKLVANAITAISWANLIFGIFNHLFSVATALMISNKHAATRTMKVLTGLGLLSLGIASTAAGLSSFALVLASCCVDTAQQLWSLSAMVGRYFFGDWSKTKIEYKSNKEQYYKLLQDPAQLALLKEYREHVTPENKHLFKGDIIALDQKLTDDKNTITHKKVKMANQFHSFAITAMTVVGASLLFTPGILVGGAILITMAIYAVADKFGVNPFRWLLNKFQGKKYEEKTHHKSIAEIESKLDKKITVEAEDRLIKHTTNETTANVYRRLHTTNATIKEEPKVNMTSKHTTVGKLFNEERVPCNDPDFTETETELATPSIGH